MAEKFSGLSLEKGQQVYFKANGIPEEMVGGDAAGYMSGRYMGTVSMSVAMSFMDVAAFNANLETSIDTNTLRNDTDYYLIQHDSDGVIRPWADNTKWVSDVNKPFSGNLSVVLYTNATYDTTDKIKDVLDSLDIAYRIT